MHEYHSSESVNSRHRRLQQNGNVQYRSRFFVQIPPLPFTLFVKTFKHTAFDPRRFMANRSTAPQHDTHPHFSDHPACLSYLVPGQLLPHGWQRATAGRSIRLEQGDGMDE